MITRLFRIAAAAALLSASAASAQVAPAAAENEGAGTLYTKEKFPYDTLVKRPLTLAGGLFQIDFGVSANLSKGVEMKPWMIPGSIDIGITKDLTLGAYLPFGLCMAGTANGCAETFNDAGARVVYSLSRLAEQQFVLRGAVFASNIKDGDYDVAVGVAFKRTLGNLALVLGAGIETQVTNRDKVAHPGSELIWADVEAELQFQLGKGIAAMVKAGGLVPVNPETGGAMDYLRVPFVVGIEWEPMHLVDAGFELGFGNAFGKDATWDEREGKVFVRMFF